MNITFYDSEASTIEFNRKFISLPSYILIADSVQLIANSCWTNLFTTDFNTITDNEIFDFAIIYYAKTEGESDRIAHFRNQYAILKKTIQNKHKDKHTAIAVEYFRTGIKHLRTGLSKEYIDFLNFYSLQELYPFLKDKTWQLPQIDFRNDPKKEDVFIQPISKTLIERTAIMGFDSIIEELFTHISIHSSDLTYADFIQIPLWHFPITEKLNHAQIKHIRDYLQSALLTFKTDLKELSQAIFPLPFSIENFGLIKQLTNDKLLKHMGAIQQSIDESLYINKAKNQFSKDSGNTFFLGIASFETVINYFEKTETILPYVAAEIKHLVSKQFDTSSSMLFSYFELNIPDTPSEND